MWGTLGHIPHNDSPPSDQGWESSGLLTRLHTEGGGGIFGGICPRGQRASLRRKMGIPRKPPQGGPSTKSLRGGGGGESTNSGGPHDSPPKSDSY